ncbi:hypothetical protein BGZ58_005869 [Dissophora ornata]|nr:hypothetical protein BGZ58_005869 [Dissophora ornata]
MRHGVSTSFIATITALILASTAQAQETSRGNRPPPSAGQIVNILYSENANVDLGTDNVPFNTCFASAHSQGTNYAYLTFAPKNATINFYKDNNCQDFAFGLDGFYIGNPGPAGSYRWVGWSEDSIGYLFDKEPIPGQGDAAAGGAAEPQTPPGGANPGAGTGGSGGGATPNQPAPAPVLAPVPAPAPAPAPDNTHKDQDGSTYSIFSTFFGGALGTLVVLSIGGVVFWKTAGKKMMEDSKNKSILPYNRVDDDGADRDGDVLLTTKDRSDDFELGDIGDDEDGDEDGDGDDDSVDHEGDHLSPQQPLRPERQERHLDDERE